MDSGNSGSVQSSSCGSEEYDSRADSISALFNHPFGNQPQPQPPPSAPPQQQTHPSPASAMFDPLSNYFDHPNSILNLDMVWSKNQRSDLGGLMTSPTSSPPTQQQTQSNRTTLPQISTVSGASDQHNNNNSSSNNDHNHNSNIMARKPKKRSRASRRAPTTVLTTDTSNFRAMVQEFTGIPSPPFARTRLDLYRPTSAMRSNGLDLSSPHYVLRPFPSQNINIQNPILNFQSLLQTEPCVRMGVLEDFVLSHGHATVSGQQHDQGLVRSINGGSQRVSNEKVSSDFSASLSDFHGEKGTENVDTTNEGMIEPWRCSSE